MSALSDVPVLQLPPLVGTAIGASSGADRPSSSAPAAMVATP